MREMDEQSKRSIKSALLVLKSPPVTILPQRNSLWTTIEKLKEGNSKHSDSAAIVSVISHSTRKLCHKLLLASKQVTLTQMCNDDNNNDEETPEEEEQQSDKQLTLTKMYQGYTEHHDLEKHVIEGWKKV